MANTSIISPYGEQYKDLDLRFKAHPEHGDVLPVRDTNAVLSSIKNLILTRPGERPFRPGIGCNLDAYLFEMSDGLTKYNIGREIELTLGKYEPRVEIENINVDDDPDTNSYNISITVKLSNVSKVTLNVNLARLR